MEEIVISTVVDQRVRNRIIEGLEMFADLSSLDILGGSGVINYWYDFVSEDGFSRIHYPEPVYSGEEIIALRTFHNTIEAYLAEIEDTLTAEEAKEDDMWLKISTTAAAALLTFQKRGRLSEDEPLFG